MQSFIHLLRIAAAGFADMRPALRRAFNDDPLDDQLRQVFGARPRLTIVAITLASVIAGLLAQPLLAGAIGADPVNLPAVFVSMAFGLSIRRYLFRSGRAGEGDFPWLAATIIPAVALLVLVSIVRHLLDGDFDVLPEAPVFTLIGGVVKLLADACAVAAGVTIAVAALCYSRRWPRALWQLALQLLIMQLILNIVLFVMLEISIMDRILSALLSATLGITLPEWIGEFIDQFTYAAILFALYFAIIGATWTVCRRSFGRLLAEGDVDIIDTVRRLVDPDAEKKARKQAEKAEAKARKQASKAEAKARKRMRDD